MRILFDNIGILDESGIYREGMCLEVNGNVISYIGESKPEGCFDRVISGKDRMLFPGLYNCHAHSAMNILRGLGEDLPLERWLAEKIYPAEDKLNDEIVYISSTAAICEMIKNGIISFSDMYFMSENTVRAVVETGIKANISRCVVSFGGDYKKRLDEGISLHRAYHKSGDGRILIDMSVHAEYTSDEASVVAVSDYAVSNGLNMHIHLSETEKEHNECVIKRGITPAEYFCKYGAFNANTTAAHCVYLTENDMKIMSEHGVSVAHCPASNLKLGSGIIPFNKITGNGLNITLGTDGAASNNSLDILKEAYISSLITKGSQRSPEFPKSSQYLPIMTVNGAKAQGRAACGKLAEGYRADIVMYDIGAINTIPFYNASDALIYNMNSSNTVLTMVDGKVLYENGEFTTIDIEKLRRSLNNLKELFI